MHRCLAALLVLLPACYKYQPPPPAEPRDATPVSASMGETWDAVIDLFATRNIPIRTIERASGIIATEGLRVEPADGAQWADCGQHGRLHYRPNTGIYNVLVRGDSTNSTVRTTVRWSYITLKDNLDCTSSYLWERGLEQEVKTRAEAAHRAALAGGDLRPVPLESESPPGRRPAHSTPTSSDDARASEVTPAPAGRIRSNDQLLESAGLRHVVTDLQRLNIVAGYRELRPDTLTVDLEDGAFTSTSTDYNLGRLFLAYRGTTEYRSGGTLELLHNGRRVGLYTKDGLVWEAVR